MANRPGIRINSTAKLAFTIPLITLFFLISLSTAYGLEDNGNVSFGNTQMPSSDLTQLLDKTSPSVVMIVVYDDTGAESKRGSGFFIDSEGRILTNADILKNAYSAEVYSGTSHYKQVTILKHNEDLDLALIQVKSQSNASLGLDSDQVIRADDEVIIVGKEEYFRKTISVGTISSISSTDNNDDLLFIEARSPLEDMPSSIDGPVLTVQGSVIGLITRTRSDKLFYDGTADLGSMENFYAISLSSIKSFLQEQYSPVVLNVPKSRVWSSWLTKSVKSYFFIALFFLYGLSLKKILIGLLIIIALLSLLNWIYSKVKLKITGK